jgi:hypothetical protein
MEPFVVSCPDLATLNSASQMMNHHSRATADLLIFTSLFVSWHRTVPTLRELNHTEPNRAVGSLPRLGSLSCPLHVALDSKITKGSGTGTPLLLQTLSGVYP